MSLQDIIYKSSPLAFQNFAISVFGYLWHNRRFGGIYKKSVKDFKKRDGYSREEWHDYQTQALRKMLIHAYENVPFYNRKYTDAGFKKKDLEFFELIQLDSLPFLEKEDLRQFGKTELLAVNRDKSGKFYSSSGSTGKPISVYLSKSSHQFWTAGYEIRVKNWAGVNKQMRRGMIGGRRILPEANAKPPYYRWNSAEKMAYFSAYHISKNTVSDYVDGIKTRKLDFMMGYAMSNYLLAKFIVEKNIKAPHLKAVITSSEKLTNEMRDIFREAYNCETFDTWSGVEACAQISECEHHTLHESPDIGIIELINNAGKSVAIGEEGETICTSLFNFDQPLIRYRCGDRLRESVNQCGCGRQMRTFSEILGRVEDVITGPDGRQMVRFHGIFIDLPGVVEGQIVQKTLSQYEIRVVTSENLSFETTTTMKKRMQSQLGEVDVQVTPVKEIPRTSNGKFKAVISELLK